MKRDPSGEVVSLQQHPAFRVRCRKCGAISGQWCRSPGRVVHYATRHQAGWDWRGLVNTSPFHSARLKVAAAKQRRINADV